MTGHTGGGCYWTSHYFKSGKWKERMAYPIFPVRTVPLGNQVDDEGEIYFYRTLLANKWERNDKIRISPFCKP